MSKARNLANLLADGAVGADELASTLDLSGKTLTLPAGTALPSQSGQNGNFLTTDGTSASWAAVGGGGGGGSSITVGDSSVVITDTGSNGKITGTADATEVFSVEKGKTFVLQGGVSSTGVGIAFPADQTTVGASSDANTLDDYEEGTFTPSVGGTATYNATYTVGFYTKIGRQVTINFSVWISSLGTGNADRIINAPFACSSAINECAGCISYHDGLATSVVFIAALHSKLTPHKSVLFLKLPQVRQLVITLFLLPVAEESGQH
jgi:hypothetical protein